MKKTQVFLILGLAFFLLFSACSNPTDNSGSGPAILSVTITSGKGQAIYPGDTVDFVADVQVSGNISKDVTWTISGNTSTDTVIEANPDSSRMATLTIGADESPGTITVKAESAAASSKFDTATVSVLPPGVPYDKIFLVGGASPDSWSIGSDNQMTLAEDGTYTWTGVLSGGALQFTGTLGAAPIDFSGGYWFIPVTDGAFPSTSAQAVEFGIGQQTAERSKKFRVPVSGTYTIVLDTEADTVTFTQVPAAPEINHIWMVGDATIGGWYLPNSRQLTKSGDVFTYTGMLIGGEAGSPDWTGRFRFYITSDDSAPADGGWSDYPELIRDADATADPGLITGQAQAATWDPAGSPYDTCWVVPDSSLGGSDRAIYTVTVDPVHYTVTVERAAAAVDESVYVVGGAPAPGDWSFDHPENYMTTTDGINFTWTGDLLADRITFAYGDTESFAGLGWTGPFFFPLVDLEPAGTTGEVQSVGFSPDSNDGMFTVTAAGTYTITLNINDLTVTFTQIAAEHAINYLWMVGDATIGGWNLSAGRELTKSGDVFTYTGMLIGGQAGSPDWTGRFRFYITPDDSAPADGGWGDYPQLIRDSDATADPGLITGQVQAAAWVSAGSSLDTCWVVPDSSLGGFDAAFYTVTVDPVHYTVKVEPALNTDTVSEKAYVVGGALGDWNLDHPGNLMITTDGINFTWTGELSADQLTFTYGDASTLTSAAWTGPFFNPQEGQDTAGTTGEVQPVVFSNGNTRNFNITQAGTYTISLDINDLAVSFLRTGD